MPDNSLNEILGDQNERLMSEYAVTRRQSRTLYRHWAILSKKSPGNYLQSHTNAFAKISSSSIFYDAVDSSKDYSSTLVEDRADEIVRYMEQNQNFMNDNPKSNNDRIETLRDMTEYLTIKRFVKKKLVKSIGSTGKTLSFCKRLKYRMSISFFKIPVTIKHCLSSYELWYSSLKVIEGHFGSNVASYFKFLRKMFLLNACIFILMLFFVMIPQLLFRFFQYVEYYENTNSSFTEKLIPENETESNFYPKQTESAPILIMKADPYSENDDFRLGNIFTGEGFLTNTILFYGYYTNSSLQLIKNHTYNIPVSYFFTSAVCYILIFLFLFISVAVSYRKCYIEASGRMNNSFTNKVFCGWDFGIATKQAAELKSKSFYIEIKELLDEMSKPAKRKTCLNTFYTTAISFSLNGILLFLLGVGGMYSWKYLDEQMTRADTATTMMMWLILTLVIAMAPVLFSLIANLEGFESPSSALYMTLIRTFTLYAVVIAVVVGYRLNRSAESICWETILGQDMYRLVVLDFIFGLIGTALSEIIRYRIYITMWQGIGCPEFDIVRSTMNLIYNQTLFYIGLYFSPVLSLIITVKLFLTFYIKKWGAIYNCKPFVKPWKASQAHTVYLSIAFLAFFCVIISFGYMITSVKTSNCGPFRGEKYMYETLLKEILSRNDSTILSIFYNITRPGVVGIVLMAMLVGVYYMRAVAMARIHVVNHLRHLLRLKGEDRKVLLNEISKYSKNQASQNEGIGPSCVEGERDLVSKNFRQKLSGSENFLKGEKKKTKGIEHLKKCRPSFSSLTNIQVEDDSKKCINKSNLFSSAHNVSNTGVEDGSEVKFRFNRKIRPENEISDVKSTERTRMNESEREDSSVDNYTKDGSLTSEVLKDEESTDQSNVRPLNFNPIFTQSFPLESDDGYDDDVNEVGNASTYGANNFPDQLHESEDKNCNSNTSFMVHQKYEDRVPSRISFDSDRDKKISKSKKP